MTQHGYRRLWVVVADGKKALFLANRDDEAHPNLVPLDRLEQRLAPTREQGTDRPGRFPDPGAPGARSAVEATDWHEIEKERFAAEVAQRINRAALADRFDRLVVIAPPRVLGELRGALHGEASGRLLAEVAKDLTKHPLVEIEAAVREAVST